MSEQKRRRRPQNGPENGKWQKPEVKWDTSECEMPFFGSYIHVVLSCYIAFAIANYRTNNLDLSIFVNAGYYIANFLLFLYLAYALLAGISCLFGNSSEK